MTRQIEFHVWAVVVVSFSAWIPYTSPVSKKDVTLTSSRKDTESSAGDELRT